MATLFRKKTKIVDERIENAKNKIYKEIYSLITIICLVSIGLKYYKYGIDIHLIWTELAILFLSGTYFLVRSASMGIYSDEVEIHDQNHKMSMNIKMIIYSFVFGVGLALFFATNSALKYGNGTNEVKYFILVFIVSIMIYLPFFLGLIFLPHFMAKIKSERKNRDDE